MALRRSPLIVLTAFLFLAFLALPTAVAEGTRTWEQSKFDDLTKGTAKGVAIRSNGGLEIAPSFKPLYTTPSTYLWAIAADAAGNVYAAAGAPARIYRVTPQGQSAVIFEPQELQVQSLLVDRDGVLYAATSPDGKVYRLDRKNAGADERANWSASVYFDPDTKYIWDITEDKAGNLYVATGDRGEIYKVTSKGEHSLFFKSDEAHIRVLAVDATGNLIAGSDGSGLVYRITPNGEAFVLYSAPKKEITALAIDASGNIYAAGVGEKRSGAGPASFTISMPQPSSSSPQPSPGSQPGISISNSQASSSPAVSTFPAPGANSTGGSEVYKIAPDGSPNRIWTSREDIVYALAFDQQGHLLAGTGNRGHIFMINGEDDFTDLAKASASQITAFAKAPNGGLYASSSNLGKLFVLGPGPETEGTYESDVFDARIFSRWGRAEYRGSGNVEVFARSGNVDNPDRNWSPWRKVETAKDAELGVPAARFVQWKAVLHAGGAVAPRVQSLLVNYLPKNVAPDIDDVTVQVGVRYPVMPKSTSSDSGAPKFDAPVAPTRDRGSIGVKWTAHDDNDDDMEYSVYYRGDGETRWLLLKDGVSDKYYSFDAGLLPDGGYTVKVLASDGPSHTPTDAVSSEKESARFEVDTTPPQIVNLAATLENGQIHVVFRATDNFSPIKHAEYSIDASDWQFVEPVGQLSDAKTESYDFRARIMPSANDARTENGGAAATADSLEHVVVVRVYDRYENMSAAKAVIRGR